MRCTCSWMQRDFYLVQSFDNKTNKCHILLAEVFIVPGIIFFMINYGNVFTLLTLFK